MDIYVSQYLNIYPSHRNSVILFSGISGAIDEVDVSFGNDLKGCYLQRMPLSNEILSKITDAEIKFLVRRGHLTKLPPKKETEVFCRYVEKLHELLNIQRKRTGSLMIVPSYYCNLACPYCFQSKLHETSDESQYRFMSVVDVDNLFLKAIPKLFPNIKRMNKISLCLYGGEPFIPQNKEAINQIMQYASRYQMNVSAVSNATEINSFLQWFGPRPGQVRSVQISLDGGRECHDRSRVGRNLEATFDKIIENVHKLVEQKVYVSLRINTLKDNFESIEWLVDFLRREELLRHPKVHVYAWAVNCHDENVDCSGFFSNYELAVKLEKITDSIESPIGRRQRRLRTIINTEDGLALKRTVFCMRNSTNSYLIDVYGDIYGCYEEAGIKDSRIGHFSNNNGVVWEAKYTENMLRHVAKCDPCNKCGLALTCGGGCSYYSEKKFKTQFKNDCDSHKECVARAMRKLFEEKISNISNTRDFIDDLDLYPNA